MLAASLRGLGVDAELRERFHPMKHPELTIYPMEAHLRLLIDLFMAGEHRVFGLEDLAADPVFVLLAGGVAPSIDTVYHDPDRFDDEAVQELGAMVVEHVLVPVRRLRRRLEAQLDIDTSVEPVFGAPEGAALGPNPKYSPEPPGATLRPGVIERAWWRRTLRLTLTLTLLTLTATATWTWTRVAILFGSARNCFRDWPNESTC